MHRSRWSIVAILTGLIAVAGCDRSTPSPEPAPPVAVTMEDVTGRWVIEPGAYRDAAYNTLKAQGASEREIDAQLETMVQMLHRNPPDYTFNADGSFSANGGGMTVTGTWTLESNDLTITSTGGDRVRRFTVEPGLLTNVPSVEGGRPVTMIRGR